MVAIDRTPRLLLRLEGIALAGAALVVYFHLDYGVIALIALLLVVDFSLVLTARGFGLKYPSSFKDTHLQRV